MEGMNELIRWMIDQSVTIYSSNPTIFRHLLDSLNNQDELPQLRLINLDGESLSRMEVERYKTLFPDNCILVNRFGSGETGTVRVFFMDKQTRIVGDLVPTGYAIDDTEILIVNEDGEVVMTNEVGEISVRGRYLTPGYWQRPDLTEAQFSPNQFGEETRTYYTGDIGRIHRDGCLEHLGRKDFQVKIRGFKVEVSEVEAALLAIESIKEAVVTGRNYRVNEKRLVAYIVPTGNPLLSIGAIRRVLLEKLPDYMIPSSFVILDALPLTATGKVNRKTLPDPGTSRPELDSPYVAPKTPVEKELSKIWSEVLSVDQVGVEDSFFDLGGDSLSATRVVSHVMRTFQLDLPLRSLFQSPTVAEMANVIAKYQGVKLGEADIAEILTELESLSDGEVQQLLADPGMTKKSCAIPQ
jgi:acyl carrier protein